MNYLIVSLIVSVVIVGSIIITPSFLTKSKFTFVSVTEVSFTPVWEQHSFCGIEELLQLEIEPNNINPKRSNPTAIKVSQKFLFFFISLFFIIVSNLLLLPLYIQDIDICDIPHLISSVYHN